VGDIATIVTPNGKRELEILKLTTVHDEVGADGAENGAGAGAESQGSLG
jgi:transcription elongation factor GreA